MRWLRGPASWPRSGRAGQRTGEVAAADGGAGEWASCRRALGGGSRIA